MDNREEKLKYLDHLQAVIARLAGNSFAFKGWAVTLAGGLGAFAAVEQTAVLLCIAIGTTLLFWALDGYYLWLERGFIELHKAAALIGPEDPVTFNMAVTKKAAFQCWLRTCLRPHLLAFYGTMVLTSMLAILFFEEVSNDSTYIFQLQI